MTSRRHFLSILAVAIGSLGCQFGRRERFAPKREAGVIIQVYTGVWAAADSGAISFDLTSATARWELKRNILQAIA